MVMDTNSEQWRHACEVRHVLSLGTMNAMKDYIDKARLKRGKGICDKLANDVRAELESRRDERKTTKQG